MSDNERLEWLESQKKENDRLTTSLHALKAHPDFIYLPVYDGHVSINGQMRLLAKNELADAGWERNQESHDDDEPGEECWRRRKDSK